LPHDAATSLGCQFKLAAKFVRLKNSFPVLAMFAGWFGCDHDQAEQSKGIGFSWQRHHTIAFDLCKAIA